MATCKGCLHLLVCKSAETCEGKVPGCKHFMAQKERYLLKENGEIVPLTNCQQWIPVVERLPEEDVRVLVYIDSDRSYTKTDTDRLTGGRWVRWGWDVTHWMPLPQPPKGE